MCHFGIEKNQQSSTQDVKQEACLPVKMVVWSLRNEAGNERRTGNEGKNTKSYIKGTSQLYLKIAKMRT